MTAPLDPETKRLRRLFRAIPCSAVAQQRHKIIRNGVANRSSISLVQPLCERVSVPTTIEESKFAVDPLLERGGFEPSVPL